MIKTSIQSAVEYMRHEICLKCQSWNAIFCILAIITVENRFEYFQSHIIYLLVKNYFYTCWDYDWDSRMNIFLVCFSHHKIFVFLQYDTSVCRIFYSFFMDRYTCILRNENRTLFIVLPLPPTARYTGSNKNYRRM